MSVSDSSLQLRVVGCHSTTPLHQNLLVILFVKVVVIPTSRTDEVTLF